MSDIFKTTLLDDGTLMIGNNTNSHANGLKKPGNCPSTISIPNRIDNKIVTGIGKYSFAFITAIKKIEFPNTLTFIDESAFYCVSSFTINVLDLSTLSNLKKLGKDVFSYCNISQLIIGPSVETIGLSPFTGNRFLEQIIVDTTNKYYSNDMQYALYDKMQTSLIAVPPTRTVFSIPDTVTKISNNVFAYSKISSIVLPAKIKTVGEKIFIACNNLVEVYIYCSLKTTGKNMFWNNPNELIIFYSSKDNPTEKLIGSGTTFLKVYTCKDFRGTFVGYTVTERNGPCSRINRITCIFKSKSSVIKEYMFFCFILSK